MGTWPRYVICNDDDDRRSLHARRNEPDDEDRAAVVIFHTDRPFYLYTYARVYSFVVLVFGAGPTPRRYGRPNR